MDSVLIISNAGNGCDALLNLLKTHEFSHITTAASGSEARRLLIDNSYDMVIINAPLKNEFGDELSLKISESTTSGVMLIVKTEIADEVSAKVEDYGVFVVSKPISKQLFFQSLKLVSSYRKRLLGLKNENVKLQVKIDEIRLIDRAKCVLIQYLNLTEPQAHRYIEKHAMDLRKTKVQIAQGILKTYET